MNAYVLVGLRLYDDDDQIITFLAAEISCKDFVQKFN